MHLPSQKGLIFLDQAAKITKSGERCWLRSLTSSEEHVFDDSHLQHDTEGR